MLAGGASSRMGTDKGSLEYRGVPMAERVGQALGQCVETVRIVLRPGGVNPTSFERIDDRHEVQAPMAGLAAALHAARTDAVLVAACDLPELDPRVLGALLALAPASGGPEIVAPIGPNGPEPLVAVYRRSLLDDVESRIASGNLALRALLDSRETQWIPEPRLRELDPDLASFRNVNRPDDLGHAPRG